MGVLTGRTALVTGASRGIGRGIAERLGREGARVAVHCGRNETAAKETVAAIERAGGSAFPVGVELGHRGTPRHCGRSPTGTRTGWTSCEQRGDRQHAAPIGQVAEREYDEVFAVNVKAPLFILKHGMTRLRDGSRVVNISSGLARSAVMPDNMAYAMTKGALDVFSRDLSKVLGHRGITVNSVTPGIIDTDNTAELLRGTSEAGRRPRRYRHWAGWASLPRSPTWWRS
ncbi:SDR family NAD(P)-dependent oxidoreductase [Streptomyces sp. NPDC006265]|uniref:SDR family NAD(P)-dependent oxidoreductase n=1 Tax=Streptomyces sp. NPDC006265 TaxID=3156740 RepID=UPI0033B305D9